MSCDGKLVRHNGENFRFIILVTCVNVYFVSGSKYDRKDTVKISEIRKILMGENSYLMVIRFGGQSDFLLLTNRRRELIKFLCEVRQYQEEPLPIEKYFSS